MSGTVVYSAQTNGFEPGFAYRNPKYFQKPLGKPEKLIVVGNWPKVVAAYEALGVQVETVSPGTPLRTPGTIAAPPKPADAQTTPPEAPQPETGGNLDNPKEPVEIPADWASMQWMKQEKLAAKIVGTTVPLATSEGQTRAAKAKAIIEAEVAERAAKP